MADVGVLKELLVSIGFALDASSLRKGMESLGQAEKQIERFSQSTNRGTTLWQRFFQQFQRAAGPQREHIDIATRLGKAYEALGINLKELAAIAAGGTIAATFANLSKSFEDLYYQADRAKTTVKNLEAVRFAAEQVGISGEEMSAALQGMQRVLATQTGRAEWARYFGLQVIDPQTGQEKDTAQLATEMFGALRKMYQQGTTGAGLALQTLEKMGVAPTQAIVGLLRSDELWERYNKSLAENLALQAKLGVNLDEFGKKAVEVDNAWRKLLETIRLVLVEFAAPWQTPVIKALNAIQQAVEGVNKALEATATVFRRGLGAYVPDINKLTGPQGENLPSRRQVQRGIGEALREGLGAYLFGGRGVRRQHGDLPWGGTLGETGHPNIGGRAGPAPRMQEGGVVPILAHSGEVILGADAVRALGGWLRGIGSFEPFVRIANIDDFTDRGIGGGDELVTGRGGQGVGRRRHGDPFGLSAPTHLSRASAASFQEMGNYLRTHYGLDPAHTQAILANILAESGGRPEAVGPGGDFGLAQWVGDRRRALMEYLSGRGMDIHNKFGQLDFLMKEIRSRMSWWLGSGGTAEGLTSSFESDFENPRVKTGRLGQLRALQGIMDGGQPIGTTNTWHAGDKTVTINAQQSFNITGDDRYAIGGAVNSAASRTNADLLRNLSAAII